LRTKEDGQVGGLTPHLVKGAVSILQYADDTILFFEHDLQKAVNMKLILCFFENFLGLKINFCKIEIYCFGKAKEHELCIDRFLDVNQAYCLFDILGYQFIIGSLRILTGTQLNYALKES
jgi:hypothetical protein